MKKQQTDCNTILPVHIYGIRQAVSFQNDRFPSNRLRCKQVQIRPNIIFKEQIFQ